MENKAAIAEYQMRLEHIEEVLSGLTERARAGDVILVEGKKDIISLKRLNIQGVIKVVTHHPLSLITEELAGMGRDVIILTDWDRRGDILAERLSEDLQYLGVNADLQLRRKLSSLVKKDIKDVEALYVHVVRLRKLVS